MSPWPTVLLPAIVTALLVRFDAKVIGPYFALSALIAASESVDRDFYRSGTMRNALARRLLYAAALGVFLFVVLDMPLWEVAATGALTAGLLLWPLVFHGLPYGVSRRDAELPVLYISFVAAYAGLAVAGALLVQLLTYVADGDLRRWFADQFLGSFSAWVVTLLVVGMYRVMVRRLRGKAREREDVASEYGWNGGTTIGEQPPEAP